MMGPQSAVATRQAVLIRCSCHPQIAGNFLYDANRISVKLKPLSGGAETVVPARFDAGSVVFASPPTTAGDSHNEDLFEGG